MTTSIQTNQSPSGHKNDEIRSRREVRLRSSRWFTVLLLGASMLLAAGHHTFGEWIFHPKVALWQESVFWTDGIKMMLWPLGFWLFWTVASLGRIRSAAVILVGAGIIGLGDWAWYSVAEFLRYRGEAVSSDYWDWWTSWAPIVAIGGNVILAIRWFRLFLPQSIQSARNGITLRRWFRSKSGLILLAVLVAIWALFFAVIYAGLPQLEVNEWTLAGAQDWLVPGKWGNDFNFVVANGGSQWRRYRIGVILDSLKLADKQRHRFYTNLDNEIYQDYILSPQIDSLPLPDLDWRPVLWEYFCPRVRRLNAPEAAAQIVVRLLRERVGIDATFGADVGVLTTWREGFTDEKGFDRIYVAALRTVGIAARLDGNARAEIWNGANWEPAPRPLITSFCN